MGAALGSIIKSLESCPEAGYLSGKSCSTGSFEASRGDKKGTDLLGPEALKI